MPQVVTAILSHQVDLAAKARLHTGDMNEAGLLVGKVISRAFLKMDEHRSPEALSAAMWRDLDKLIEQRLAS